MSASAEVRIGGGTHVVGIIGWPVSAQPLPGDPQRCASPRRASTGCYVPLPVRPEWLQPALIGLVPLGFAGANVTMPHKTEAADLIQHRSDDATLLQAVNTIAVRGGELEGHNTDVAGFDRFLRRDAGFDPAGTIRAAVRSRGGRPGVRARAGPGGTRGAHRGGARRGPGGAPREDGRGARVPVTLVRTGRTGELTADLVVNATPVGGRDAEQVLPSLPHLGSGVLVIDLLYDPPVDRPSAASAGGRGDRVRGARPSARAGGPVLRAVDGTPAPLEVMSAAALACLAER